MNILDNPEEIYQALRQPFDPSKISWRVGQQGVTVDGRPWVKPLAYLTSRDVMKRLDDVVGFHCWQDKMHELKTGTCCELSILIGGNWITKSDVSGDSNVDPEKGGASGALKRAAAKFGIGRYLYYLPNGFAEIVEGNVTGAINGWIAANTKGNKFKKDVSFKWLPYELPVWAKPKNKAEE